MCIRMERGRGESEKARQKGLEHVTWARREAEASRVSTRRDVAKDSVVAEGVSRPPNSINTTQKTILSPTKPNVHSPLKTVLNTTRKYRQKDNRTFTNHRYVYYNFNLVLLKTIDR